MARLILDTGVLVAAVTGRLDLSVMTDEDDLALPAVAVAEYLVGVLLDNDQARQTLQRAFLQDVLSVTPIVDYDSGVAKHHAELLAHVRKTGHRRGTHGLLIASTARATERTLVTTDAKACFDQLPEVRTRVLDP